jgi:DNA repair exonuclease SbcCD ATPase subunit
MTNWDGVLGILTALLGCSTLVSWVLYRRANQRIKDAEAREQEAKAKSQEVANEKALRDVYEDTIRELREEFTERIKELHSTISDINTMYHNAITDSAKKDDTISDKTSKIRELNDLLFQQQKETSSLQSEINKKDNYIATLQRFNEYLKLWHCERELPTTDTEPAKLSECCERRKPPHNIPMKYTPYTDITDDSSKA